MTHLSALIFSPACRRLAATLLHFVWQGALLAALYAIARIAFAGGSARARYGIACAFLALMAAALVVTWLWLAPPAASPAAYTSAATARQFHRLDGITVPAAAPAASGPASLPDPWPAFLVALWLLGVAMLAARNAGGWLYANRLPHRRSRTAPPAWQERLDLLARRMCVARPVRLLTSAAVAAPVVVGWLRPAILIPLSTLARLSPEQFEAVLAHELAHVLRHDYLANLLQTAAETLLFYHPAVWWMSAQVRAEREACCDDLAVANSGDALVYAQALLALEQQRGWPSSPALAATGGSLARRVARLVGAPRASSSSPLIVALAVAAIVVAPIAVTRAARAQSVTGPRFDVASVKPSNGAMVPGDWAGVRPLPGGRFQSREAALSWIVQAAYNVQPYQLVGGDAAALSQHYDIEAHGDPSASTAQVALMLRALIEDRFQFRYHRETRELPVFVLTAGRSGLHLPTPVTGFCRPYAPPGGSDLTTCANIGTIAAGSLSLSGGSIHMARLAQLLAQALGRPVLDQTGANAAFDVNLTFRREDGASYMPQPPGPAGHDEAEPLPSIAAALDEQLGIHLESTQGPVEVMVIDHLTKPTPN